jgi:ubiquinone/menaquinone biosynthesis C-methylase UbiE
MKTTIDSASARSDEPAAPHEGRDPSWDSVAAGWKTWWPTIENGARHVSRRLIELVDVRPGQRLLDIATGIGEPALSAASVVGPAGRVVATDLSSAMLDIARERAAAQGLTNVEFLQADAERLDFPDGSFDAVLCRWGLDDLPNPSETLRTIRRLLTPTGAFAAAVWDAGPEARPLSSLAMALAREMFDPPSLRRPEAPSPPESAENWLENAMTHAGFAQVHVEAMTLTLAFSSADDCTRYLTDVSPLFAAVLFDQSAERQTEYRRRLAEKLQRYAAPDGTVRIPNATLCAVGRR